MKGAGSKGPPLQSLNGIYKGLFFYYDLGGQQISRMNASKDLGHFWLGYIRMLGHLQMSAHLVNFDRLLRVLATFEAKWAIFWVRFYANS